MLAFCEGRADSAAYLDENTDGYVDVDETTAAELPDTVGLLHATGEFGAYETVTFRGVPVTRLT